jgi:hypothetical protein
LTQQTSFAAYFNKVIDLVEKTNTDYFIVGGIASGI